MQFLQDTIHAFWLMLGEAGLWLLFGFALAGVMHAMLPANLLLKHLGGRGFFSVFKASALGVPLPLCSCSVVPAAAALKRGGASDGSSAAFAISTPEVDAPSIAITWGMLGPVMAITRPIVAFITAITVGVFIDRLPAQERDDASGDGDDVAQKDDAGDSCCHTKEAAPTKKPPALVRALRFTLVTLPADLGGWILFGLALSAVIVTVIPDGWIAAQVESGALGPVTSKLIMLVIGIPWYICATASTPLAASLVAKGLSPGAALVFLLAGPATNPATMGWVYKFLGVRALAVYLTGISVVAVGAGIVLDVFMGDMAMPVFSSEHAHGTLSLSQSIAAGVLLALLVFGFGWSVLKRVRSTNRSCHADVDDAA